MTEPHRGLQEWPLQWLAKPGVVCYERAHGRIRSERNGEIDEEFAKRLVWTDSLPTAVASPSDHFILVQPGKAPRFLSVEEVSRAFGLPEGGPTWKALLAPEVMTATQAVSCLGRSVQVDVARALVALLVQEGTIAPGCTYGSMFSGVDTFAAAVEAELGAAWTYAFAGEWFLPARRALLHAHVHTNKMGNEGTVSVRVL